jgi:hypothetical protein
VILDYARRRGFEVVRTYADEGKSGLTATGRDSLRAMIDDVQSGRADLENMDAEPIVYLHDPNARASRSSSDGPAVLTTSRHRVGDKGEEVEPVGVAFRSRPSEKSRLT